MKKIKTTKYNSNDLRTKALFHIKKNIFLNFFFLFIFLFLFLITITLIFINTREMQPNDPSFLKNAYLLNEKLFNIEKKPIAIVNGEKIDFIEIEKRYNSLPDYYKAMISFEDVLNQYIDEKLLTQDIKNKKIQATEDEIKNEI
ncbi:MAG: SurA N-terminal domain-containing protein, partial [Candidatus Woesearchaeota archaeon]